MASAEFLALMEQKRDAAVAFNVEIIDLDDNVFDVTAYWQSGGNMQRARERAPDELEAGSFDIVLMNTDDAFSENVPGSIFYQEEYTGWTVRIAQGFVLADGTLEIVDQCVGLIDDLEADPSTSTVTLRCRDLMRFIIDGTFRAVPFEETGVPDPANVGNGIISAIATRPFKTVSEDWTITCTTPGDDAVAEFTVVGSVTGALGTVLSGNEFSTGTGPGGIKFTITAGSTNWEIGDEFTFSTIVTPQWTADNPGKILWALMTGYDWDTDTLLDYSAGTMGFDHTKSDANVDLDFLVWEQSIADLDAASYAITGYIPYDSPAAEVVQGLLLLFLGSMFTGNGGRIKMTAYTPHFVPDTYRNFADTKQISSFGYTRSVEEVINQISVKYRATDSSWPFSDDDDPLDGPLVYLNADSIAAVGQVHSQSFNVPWFSAGNGAIGSFSDRLLDKFQLPPLNIDFETGMDGMLTEIGDRVSVSDDKYGMSVVTGEVARVEKIFDSDLRRISLRIRRDADVATRWGFLGSSADEGDGISPQALNYDDADETDKLFAYLGTPDAYLTTVQYLANALPQNSTPQWSHSGSAATQAIVGGELHLAGVTITTSYSLTGLDLRVGEEFGIIARFPTLGSYGSGTNFGFYIRAPVPNKNWALSFSTSGIRQFAGVTSGPIAYIGDPADSHVYRFVIKANLSLDVYIDGTFAGNLSTAGAGGTDEMVMEITSGIDVYIDEVWYYKLGQAIPQNTPDYRLF